MKKLSFLRLSAWQLSDSTRRIDEQVFLFNDANIYCGIILIFEDINFEVPKLRYRRDRHCRLYYTDAAVSLGKGKNYFVIVSLHLDFMV